MKRQRVWVNLSEKYRRRLERGGIDKSAYESGANLTTARGHARDEGPRRFVGRATRKGILPAMIRDWEDLDISEQTQLAEWFEEGVVKRNAGAIRKDAKGRPIRNRVNKRIMRDETLKQKQYRANFENWLKANEANPEEDWKIFRSEYMSSFSAAA